MSHSKSDLDAGRVLRIHAHGLDPAGFHACVADRGARQETASGLEVCMVGNPTHTESAGYGQDRSNQESRCYQYEKSYPSLLALTIHDILISKAPLSQLFAAVRSPVSICR